MRTWILNCTALLLAVFAVGYAGTHLHFTKPPPARASLPHGSYLGVFEYGAPPDYQRVTGFAKTAGKKPNLVGYYSGWAEPFAVSFAQQAESNGATPYVQIDPTYASVSDIADGAYDAYLHSYADSVREFRKPVVIGFGHEMNASTYSWGYTHVKPAVFVAAWQHIVTLFRQAGADNVTWLWTVNAAGPDTARIASWWPGKQYVTWVGIDGYYYRPADTFRSVFGQTITQVRDLTQRPVLLSETAVGPRTAQFRKIANLFAGMKRNKLLGLVWFDETQQGGPYRQNWRLEGNFEASTAFQLGVQRMTLARRPR
jgi:mannan endo-1,4-beta-mannosidase